MEKDKTPYRLLVVEDNPGDFLLLEEYIEEYVFNPEIVQANCHGDAIRELENQAPFDLIFLDLSLPDLQGEALIENVVELAGNSPVVVLTGYSDMQFSIHSLSLGVEDYLLKDELTAPIIYKSIVYNIEKRKNKRKLQESEKRYSDLFHLSPQPMWVFDLETLRFLDVNQAAVDLYGYSQEEFLTMDASQIRPKDEIPRLYSQLEILRKDPTQIINARYQHVLKNGTPIMVEVWWKYVEVKQKPAIMVVVNDITQQQEYIEAIEGQNKRLQEIAWMQSHIMRAPVARILGLVQLLQQFDHTPEQITELLQHIFDSSEELDKVIREIVNKASEAKLYIAGLGMNKHESQKSE
jgi:PAS domain S-box-containing protein